LTTVNTAKATINTGAGNDKLTINATLAAGSSVQLGTGDDKLLKGILGINHHGIRACCVWFFLWYDLTY
jgi:hypothetical protein